MAKLSLAITENGCQIVFRELLPRNLFHLRLRAGFVTGTRIREALTPHPHLVGSLGRGRKGLIPHELIEFVQGDSLNRLMHQKDERVLAEPVEILRQAAAGLGYMHQNGYVHLDIKEENFLVSHDGNGKVNVKLTDFDLSCVEASCGRKHRSGTVAYMAPEQIRRQPVSFQADVFAFGIVAYHLAAGRMPFIGKSEKQRRWKQTSESYRLKPPSTYNPQLGPKLDRLIVRCLEKRPENRHPSMVYVCKGLERA